MKIWGPFFNGKKSTTYRVFAGDISDRNLWSYYNPGFLEAHSVSEITPLADHFSMSNFPKHNIQGGFHPALVNLLMFLLLCAALWCSKPHDNHSNTSCHTPCFTWRTFENSHNLVSKKEAWTMNQAGFLRETIPSDSTVISPAIFHSSCHWNPSNPATSSTFWSQSYVEVVGSCSMHVPPSDTIEEVGKCEIFRS